MLQFLPAILGAAGATGMFKPDMINRQAAPTAGGQQNPMQSAMTSYFPPPTGAAAPPGINAGALPQGVPPMAMPATTDLESAGGPKGREEQKSQHEIGDLIASIPEALALAAPMLGLTPDQDNKQPAPTAGSTSQNQSANFANLPRPPSLGELLAALPRMR